MAAVPPQGKQAITPAAEGSMPSLAAPLVNTPGCCSASSIPRSNRTTTTTAHHLGRVFQTSRFCWELVQEKDRLPLGCTVSRVQDMPSLQERRGWVGIHIRPGGGTWQPGGWALGAVPHAIRGSPGLF